MLGLGPTLPWSSPDLNQPSAIEPTSQYSHRDGRGQDGTELSGDTIQPTTDGKGVPPLRSQTGPKPRGWARARPVAGSSRAVARARPVLATFSSTQGDRQYRVRLCWPHATHAVPMGHHARCPEGSPQPPPLPFRGQGRLLASRRGLRSRPLCGLLQAGGSKALLGEPRRGRALTQCWPAVSGALSSPGGGRGSVGGTVRGGL